MTPWLRPLLILTLLLAVSPFSIPSVSYAVEPSPNETRAGSAPGDGRARPGRADPVPPPPPSRSASVPAHRPKPPPAQADKQADEKADLRTTASEAARRTASEPAVVPGLRVLPLGSGLVLIGLGLGFFAVRLRRG